MGYDTYCIHPTIIDIDTTICYGDGYTFTNGHVIQNITSDTNYNSILIGPGICDIITNTVIHVQPKPFPIQYRLYSPLC